ncbi:hypothetical protein [Streptococcus sp. CSL10205-OR2]|uniref:hypothetical protein n=1 Tax=Streptococcus sp. CSL10205-OR2 TaxID=2980558 RepID=UPI0021D9D837|nr:hypothetical protein [Streptococcus sp. CSL10205-OR2]MCU9533533.1 hypothetical protein [Streptococcus sp. CSL10205-OR2]
MAKTRLTWEEVSQYEQMAPNGKIWRHNGLYYLVNEEGIAAERVVYELPEELYRLYEKGERTLADISFKIETGRWPLTEEEERANEKKFVLGTLTALVANPKSHDLFSQEELEELIPIAEKEWIDWKGKLPDDYVSPLKNKKNQHGLN